mmetsp:Transcript_17596/g.17669  ORF Transcript_17596/g.17669 Transcript_17596/m.17669 type:complete len:252 (+) Transcript_17596:118-873(+)
MEWEDLPPMHGCMIGRAAYSNPLMFAQADSSFFLSPDPPVTRRSVIQRYLTYCEQVQSGDGPIRSTPSRRGTISTSFLLRALHNVCVGCQGNQRFRIAMNDSYIERVRRGDSDPPPRDIVEEALCQIKEVDLDARLGNLQFNKDVPYKSLSLRPERERERNMERERERMRERENEAERDEEKLKAEVEEKREREIREESDQERKKEREREREKASNGVGGSASYARLYDWSSCLLQPSHVRSGRLLFLSLS